MRINQIALILFSISLLLLPLQNSFAANASISSRLKSQEVRIQKGRDRGQLTKQEERSLKREHSRIKNLVKRLARDKKFTRKEVNQVHRALNRSSQNIFKKRYNKVTTNRNKGRSRFFW